MSRPTCETTKRQVRERVSLFKDGSWRVFLFSFVGRGGGRGGQESLGWWVVRPIGRRKAVPRGEGMVSKRGEGRKGRGGEGRSS